MAEEVFNYMERGFNNSESAYSWAVKHGAVFAASMILTERIVEKVRNREGFTEVDADFLRTAEILPFNHLELICQEGEVVEIDAWSGSASNEPGKKPKVLHNGLLQVTAPEGVMGKYFSSTLQAFEKYLQP